LFRIVKERMNFYDFPLTSLQGHVLPASLFRDKKILIVNVASACGYTSQYAPLQELHEEFKDKLVVLGCPCNDFGGQEPGTEKEISTFCETSYGVTFPMTQKLEILQNTHPLYQWLCTKEKNGVADFEVSWNFQKFLVDENGMLITSLDPGISPLDETILDWVKN